MEKNVHDCYLTNEGPGICEKCNKINFKKIEPTLMDLCNRALLLDEY
jgi:hypothetical protein